MQFEKGQDIGPWTLISPLGEGGNSEVWIATREEGPERALKILLSRRPAGVPYQRFRREIETHSQIGERSDVVPMLDANLPEAPTKSDRAWLEMPIATPVRDALDSEPLARVVESVASFSATLASLEQEFGIAHRDVKPGNLYRHESSWAVGDLGLVDVPGAEALTDSDRIVGPVNFVAYEMMVEADAANPHLADVYSMAKTLWVLATGQRWPPPGHQPAGAGIETIGSYRAHPRSAELDRLIDRCTRRPEERPTMQNLSDELKAWLEEPMAEGDDLDLDDVKATIRSRLAPQVAEEQAAQERLQEAQRSADRLAERIGPLVVAVRDAVPNADSRVDDRLAQTLVLPIEALGVPGVDRYWMTGVRCVGPGTLPVTFRLIASVAVLDDGQLHIAGAYSVAAEEVLGGGYSRRYEPALVLPGSLAADRAIDSLAAEMRGDLKEALAAFSDAI